MPEPADAAALAGRVASLLRDAYGFRHVAIGDRLQGGYANDLFRLTADGSRLVLRLKYPPILAGDLAWEHATVRALAERLREVSPPLETRDGRSFLTIEGRAAWLEPFVEGAPADPTLEGHRLTAAAALGRLHRAGADLRLAPRPRLRPVARLAWPPPVVSPELRDWAATIARERAWAISFVAGVARRRRPASSLIHGDFFPGNVLVARGEAAAIIDWEEAQVDWLTWDLANAIGTFCAAGQELDQDACRRFVDAYRAAGGTASPAEEDLLVPLVRVKRILEVLRAPTDRHPRWEHQLENLRSLAGLMS